MRHRARVVGSGQGPAEPPRRWFSPDPGAWSGPGTEYGSAMFQGASGQAPPRLETLPCLVSVAGGVVKTTESQLIGEAGGVVREDLANESDPLFVVSVSQRIDGFDDRHFWERDAPVAEQPCYLVDLVELIPLVKQPHQAPDHRGLCVPQLDRLHVTGESLLGPILKLGDLGVQERCAPPVCAERQSPTPGFARLPRSCCPLGGPGRSGTGRVPSARTSPAPPRPCGCSPRARGSRPRRWLRGRVQSDPSGPGDYPAGSLIARANAVKPGLARSGESRPSRADRGSVAGPRPGGADASQPVSPPRPWPRRRPAGPSGPGEPA